MHEIRYCPIKLLLTKSVEKKKGKKVCCILGTCLPFVN